MAREIKKEIQKMDIGQPMKTAVCDAADAIFESGVNYAPPKGGCA